MENIRDNSSIMETATNTLKQLGFTKLKNLFMWKEGDYYYSVGFRMDYATRVHIEVFVNTDKPGVTANSYLTRIRTDSTQSHIAREVLMALTRMAPSSETNEKPLRNLKTKVILFTIREKNNEGEEKEHRKDM